MAKYKKRADGRYSTTVQNGYKPNGKPNLISIYAKTIRELEEKRDKTRREINFHSFVDEKVKFKDYAYQWFETKKINISHHTSRMYDIVLRNYTGSIDNKYLKDIQRPHIQQIINKYKDKPRTCQQIKITLNQIFECAIDDSLTIRNPCRKLILPKPTVPNKRALTASEHRLSDISDFNDREMAFIKMIKYCGLRKEEALALTRDSFNFIENTVTVNKALIFINNKPTFKEPKSKAGYRTIPMIKDCAAFMMYYVNSLSSNYLFTNILNGELITEQGFKKMWNSIIGKMKAKAEELKLDETIKLSPHIFRHNYATMLYYSGVTLKEAQYLLGHSSVQITMDIYTHLDHDRLEVTSKLDKFISTLP